MYKYKILCLTLLKVRHPKLGTKATKAKMDGVQQQWNQKSATHTQQTVHKADPAQLGTKYQ